MCPQDLLSTFCACAGLSVDFRELLCIRGTFRQLSMLPQGLSSAFRMAAGLSVKFQQTSVHLQYLPSTSDNFLGTREIFRKQSAQRQNLPSISVDFPCIGGTYHKLPPTFREAGGPPVNFPSSQLTFRQDSLRPRDLSTSFHFPLLLGSSSSSTEFQTHEIFSYDSYFHYSIVRVVRLC